MKRFMIFLCLMGLALLGGSCDVHEFPEVPESRPHVIRLNYETELSEWNMDYFVSGEIKSKAGDMTKSVVSAGMMRYVIRTYPKNEKNHVQEFVFTRNVSDSYDAEFTVDINPGEYRVMVWSDLIENPDDEPFYDFSDFSEIKTRSRHEGSTDYRDAFRGYADLEIFESILEETPNTTEIEMVRPLAKYEFISNDLEDFITKVTKAEKEKQAAESKTDYDSKGDSETKTIDISDYIVRFIYSPFMPNTFDMFQDKPVYSATNVSFDSKITALDEHNASMGFDYVFVNGNEAKVDVKLAIYNKAGELISLTETIKVPVKRGRHTIMTGSFLMQNASGGVGIKPGYDGPDYNVPI